MVSSPPKQFFSMSQDFLKYYSRAGMATEELEVRARPSPTSRSSHGHLSVLLASQASLAPWDLPV